MSFCFSLCIIKKYVRSFILPAFLLASFHCFAQVTYDWTGAASSSWTTAANWKIGSVVAVTYPGTVATDIVRIGTNINFTNQPVLSSPLPGSIASLTFGVNNNTTIVLTVNAVTLTVSGDVSQNHSNANNIHRTAITGSGTLVCQNVDIGNSNIPASGSIEQDSTIIGTLINQFTINGNINLKSNASTDGNAVYFPAFNIDANTVTLNGQIVTTNTNSITTQYANNYSYPTRGRLNVNSDATGNYSNTLILNNINPIKSPVASDQGVDFNNQGLSTNSVVDYNSAANGQVVYTSADGIGSAGDNYLNLTLSGAGKKVFDGSTVSIAGNMVTGGGAVDMTANNPVVSVYGNWTNQTTTAAGTGAIAISGNLANNSGAIINGSATAAAATVNGTMTNNGTLTANAENITIKGAAANYSVITGGAGALLFSGTYTNYTGAGLTTGSGTTTFTGTYVNTAGAMTMTTGIAIFKANYTAAAGATFTAGAGMAYFSGSGQTLLDNSTAGTVFNNVTFNGSGTTTIASGTGNFGVSPTGVLTMVSPAKLVAGSTAQGGAAYLTLHSDATGTGSIAAISGSSSVTGNVTVQRYLNGGNNYRSYRILSSPVYSGTAGSNNVYSINYLQNSMYLTGNAGGGFDKTGNPTLYLYREDLTPSNATFTSGNFLGISAINNTPAYNYYLNGGSTAYSLPAGSGLLCFFRGSRAAATVATETTLGYVPVTTTLSTTGLLNQGTIAAHNWYTPSSANLAYTTANTGNSPVRGYNMAGNPYPSSIDWSRFSATSSSAAIYGPNVSPAIYEFDPVTRNYGTYNAVTGISTGNGGRIIASGEGFFVQALNGSATLTFSEAAKTSTQPTGSSLLFALRRDSNLNQGQKDGYGSYMRLKLETDTINYSDMVIGFNPDAQDGFNPGEDSAFLPGVGGSKQSVAAIGSDNIKAAAKWLALAAG